MHRVQRPRLTVAAGAGQVERPVRRSRLGAEAVADRGHSRARACWMTARAVAPGGRSSGTRAPGGERRRYGRRCRAERSCAAVSGANRRLQQGGATERAAKAHARAPTKRLERSGGNQPVPKQESRVRADGGTQEVRGQRDLLNHP
jgi:hypothetical protein